MRPLRIFVPSSRIPRPDESAGDKRFLALLQILARNHRVDFCVAEPLATREIRRGRTLLNGIGVRFLRPGWRSFASALFWNWYDIGLFEFYWLAEQLASHFRAKQPHAIVLVDSVDLHFVRERAAADLGLIDPQTPETTRRREMAVYRSADAVIAASQSDATLLEREGGIGRIFVVPIILASRPRACYARASDVLFVGGFSHPPNLDGLLWFVNESWPRIRRGVPDATLSIVGSNPSAQIFALSKEPGIQVLGQVEDTAPYLDRATVSVAPLRFGAGMKGKVVEALACGVPVVTTSVGIQGLSPQIGRDLAVADDPTQFADAVITLLRDPDLAERMGLAGQRLATGLCDPDRIALNMGHMLDQLVAHRSTSRSYFAWLISAPQRSWRILRRRVDA